MDNRADIFIDKLSTKPFRIVEEHAGGFGRVIIVQSGSPEKYALKTLKWELGADRNELLREATRHARLPNHPNVIEIFGAFWLEGAPYFIMPFCPGSLSDEMRRLGGISEAEVIKIVTSVASGLSFLHDKSGILHLDLKPQNILTTAAGEYVISDFGISKFFSREQSLSVNAALFVSGVSGTLAYMSPEHFVSKELSAKSDVWALGVIMFELLTRRHPFLDTTAERLIRKVLYDEVTFTLRERLRIPRILRKLCLACLQKNPRKRPTGAQIHEALRGKGHAIEPFDAERFDLVGTMNRATTFSELGNRQEAKRLLLECLIHDPWSLSVRLNLAEVLFEEGDVSKAIETAEEALSLAKWSPDTGRSNVTLLLNLSYYNLIVDPRKSLEYGRAALEAAPADWHVLGNVAEACRLCVKALEPNNTTLLDEGFSACKKALTLNPKDEILRVTFAGLLFLSDRKAEFFRYLQELMQEIGDHNAPVRVLYVEALIRNGQLETARKLINEMRSTKVFQQIVPTLDRCLAEKVGHQSAGT